MTAHANRESSLGFKSKKETDYREMVGSSIQPLQQTALMSAIIQQNYTEKGFSTIAKSSIKSVTDSHFQTNPQIAIKSLFNIKDKDIQHQISKNNKAITSHQQYDDKYQKIGDFEIKLSIKKKNNENALKTPIKIASEYLNNEILKKYLQKDHNENANIAANQNEQDQRLTYETDISQNRELASQKIKNEKKKDDAQFNLGKVGSKKVTRVKNSLGKVLQKKQNLLETEAKMSMNLLKSQFKVENFVHQMKYKKLNTQSQQTIFQKVDRTSRTMMTNNVDYSSIQNIPTDFQLHSNRNLNIPLEKLLDIEKDSSFINENQLNISDNNKESQIFIEQQILNRSSYRDKNNLQNIELDSSQGLIKNKDQEKFKIQKLEFQETQIKNHSVYSSADRMKIDDQFSEFNYGSQIYLTNTEEEEENKNQKLQQVYQNMDRTTQNHGYAKSPDFYFQREYIQRQKINQWLKSRGKASLQSQQAYQFKNQLNGTKFNVNNKILIRNHLNFIKVEDPIQKLNILQKNDYEIYMDKDLEKTNQHLSMDTQNQEIMQFCTFLFLSWMEDYKYYAEFQKDQNMTHHLYSLNEGLEINIQENCLPIDYFMERMFQIGLCTSILSMKKIIDDMLQNDNAGFTKKIRDENDQFEPMNFHSKESLKFIKHNLDKNLLNKTDRISINQFLSLFNVIGVGNSKKIDKFLDILKVYSVQQRQQTAQKNSSKNSNSHFEKSQKQDKNLWKKIKDKQNQIIKQQALQQDHEYLNKIKEQSSKFQRKIAGLVGQNLDKQSIYKYMQIHRPNSQENIRTLQLKDHEPEITQLMHLHQSKAEVFTAPHKPKLRSVSPSLNINNQNLDFFNISQDEKFYENVMKQLKSISNISEFIKESQKLHVDNTYQELNNEYNMLINNGTLINPRVILEAIQGKNKEIINLKKRNFLSLFNQNITKTSIIRNSNNRINIQDQKINQQKGINIANFLKQNNQMVEVKEIQESQVSGNKSIDNDELRFEEILQKTKNLEQFQETQQSKDIFDVMPTTNSFDNEKNEENESPRKEYTVRRALKLIKQQSTEFNSPMKSSQNDSPTLQLRSSSKKKHKLQRKLSLVKKFSLDPEEAKYLKEKHQIELLKKQIEEHSNEQMQELNKIENNIDTIRKQLILLEICNDLIQIQQILGGLLIYDSTNAITTKYNNQKFLSNQISSNDTNQIKVKHSSSANNLKSKVYNQTFYKNVARNNLAKLEFEKFSKTFNDLQIFEKRQYFRKQFHEFVIIKMKEKYSQQMNILYSNEEYKLGKNLFKGASVEMNKDPFDYGIQARTHLIKIASLMIQNKVYLDTKNFFNLCQFAKKQESYEEKQYPGILGWLVELSQHDDIRKELSKLVNLVIQQIKDRESTFSYPNEDIEDILIYGEKIWSTQIDIKNNLIVQRHVLDQFLLQNKVIKDYKEVNRLIAGVLNGQNVQINEGIKKSQFMKIVYKAALRESIKNIIAFNQFGMDTRMINLSGTSKDYQTIPISLQILRLQRLILYSGIKTKNSNGLPVADRKDFLERSISCQNIVQNLQKLKQNNNIDSADGCKIILQKYNEQFQKFKHKQLIKNQVYENLDPTQEWQAIHKNDDCYKYENDQTVEQHLKDIQNLGNEEKLQIEEINEFQKNIYRKLTSENEGNQKSRIQGNHLHTSMSHSNTNSQLNKIQIQKTLNIGKSILIKKSPIDLPQVKQVLKVKFDNENGEIANIVHQNVKNLNHHINKFSFGNPEQHFLNKNKNSIQNKRKDETDQNNKNIKLEMKEQNDQQNKKYDNIEAKIQRLYDLGENDKQINERISLVQRQNYRSAFGREMLKKAVYKHF